MPPNNSLQEKILCMYITHVHDCINRQFLQVRSPGPIYIVAIWHIQRYTFTKTTQREKLAKKASLHLEEIGITPDSYEEFLRIRRAPLHKFTFHTACLVILCPLCTDNPQ